MEAKKLLEMIHAAGTKLADNTIIAGIGYDTALIREESAQATFRAALVSEGIGNISDSKPFRRSLGLVVLAARIGRADSEIESQAAIVSFHRYAAITAWMEKHGHKRMAAAALEAAWSDNPEIGLTFPDVAIPVPDKQPKGKPNPLRLYQDKATFSVAGQSFSDKELSEWVSTRVSVMLSRVFKGADSAPTDSGSEKASGSPTGKKSEQDKLIAALERAEKILREKQESLPKGQWVKMLGQVSALVEQAKGGSK